jgi:hypothetical protein
MKDIAKHFTTEASELDANVRFLKPILAMTFITLLINKSPPRNA